MSKVIRKTFIFPSEGALVLEWLKRVCRVSTDAEVVRFALGGLSDLMTASESGEKIFIRSKDGSEREYHPVFDVEGANEIPLNEIAAFKATLKKGALA